MKTILLTISAFCIFGFTNATSITSYTNGTNAIKITSVDLKASLLDFSKL